MTTKRTYCRICEAACGLLADVEDKRVVRLRPDRDHPVSRGFVCAKGTRFAEVAYHPERLLAPQLRDEAGVLGSVSWARANRVVGERLRTIIERHGPHAVGLYFGNPVAFNARAAFMLPAFNKLLGTRNVFSAGSQDCNNKFAGARMCFGSPLMQPFPDFEHTELALVLGSNPAVSQASFVHLPGGSQVFQRLIDRGGQVVWIDPRRSESAARWGEHLAIRPRSDAFLLLALLALVAGDRSWPDVEGLDTLIQQAQKLPMAEAAARTGIAETAIVALAQRIAASPSTALHLSVGVAQSGFGTLCYVLLQALAYVSGNFDQRGGLLVSPVSRALARLFSWAGLDAERHSRVHELPSNMGTLPAAIMADEILTPGAERVRALIVLAGDPLLSVPGGERLREALSQLDMLVCIDMFENATGAYAHALLPCTSWLERWDLSGTTLQFSASGLVPTAAPVIEPLGQSRHDARILADLAQELGGPAWFKLFGLSLDRWLPSFGYGLPNKVPRPGSYRGPLRFWEPALAAEITRLRQPDEADFVLLCRRRRIGHNSWLHGGARRDPEDRAWMHRDDMAARGFADDQRITIATEAGTVAIEVRADDSVPPNSIVVPHGLSTANVNALFPTSPAAIERLSGMVTLSGIPAEVSASEPVV